MAYVFSVKNAIIGINYDLNQRIEKGEMDEMQLLEFIELRCEKLRKDIANIEKHNNSRRKK